MTILALTAALTGFCQQDTASLIGAYHVAFDRAPDEAGLEYWVQLDGPLYPKLYWMMQSPEAQTVTVEDIYRRALGREPDRAGFEYWSGMAERDGHLGRVLHYILQSPEWRARAQFAPHWPTPSDTNVRDIRRGVCHFNSPELHAVAIDLTWNNIDLSPNVYGPAAINAGWFEYTPAPTPRGFTVYDGIVVPSVQTYPGDEVMLFGDGWAGMVPSTDSDIRAAVTGHPLLIDRGLFTADLRVHRDPAMMVDAPRTAIAIIRPDEAAPQVLFLMSKKDMTAKEFRAAAHDRFPQMRTMLMLDGGGSSQMYVLGERQERAGRGTRSVPWFVVVLP